MLIGVIAGALLFVGGIIAGIVVVARQQSGKVDPTSPKEQIATEEIEVMLHKASADVKLGIVLLGNDAPNVERVNEGGVAVGVVFAGDVLMSVNDVMCDGHDHATGLLRGAEGEVKLVVHRPILEEVIVLLNKDFTTTKVGIVLTGSGAPKVESVARDGIANLRVFAGDLLLSVNGVECDGFEHGVGMLKSSEGDMKLVVRRPKRIVPAPAPMYDPQTGEPVPMMDQEAGRFQPGMFWQAGHTAIAAGRFQPEMQSDVGLGMGTPMAVGEPIPAAPAFPRKFDPETGEPLPKFDAETGVQNW